MRRTYARGFTLIEISVVLAMVMLLSTVVINTTAASRMKARDAQRKSDLREIAVALEMYRDKYNTYAVSGSGYANGGQGWLAFEGAYSYTTAVTRALYNEGFLRRPIMEDPSQNPGYMIFVCTTGYALSATLEQPSAADIAFIQTTCNGTGANGSYTVYGKNHAVTGI